MAQTKLPKKVSIAIILFCLGFIPGIIRSVILVKTSNDPNHELFAVLLAVASISLPAFLIYKIYRGKDYARSIFVILMLTLITSNIMNITPQIDNHQLSIALIVMEIVLNVTGFYLIYHKDSSEWFKSATEP